MTTNSVIFQENLCPSATGERITISVYEPQDKPLRGVLQIVHGMAEHFGRYDRTARALCERGYAVVGHTLAGHGKDTPVRGYFGEENGWKNLVLDIDAVREFAQERFQQRRKDVPYFLLGHSMGSFLVRTYALVSEDGLSGVILSGTGMYGAAAARAGLVIADVLKAFGRAKKPSKTLHRIVFGANNKAFEPARTPCDWLSRDERAVDAYIQDELCGFPFTAGGYADLFTGLLLLSDKAQVRRMNPDIPVLLFSGDRDPVGGSGAGVREVYLSMKDAGIRDVTLTLYQGGRHEMFNETNADDVVRDLAGWMDARGGQGKDL